MTQPCEHSHDRQAGLSGPGLVRELEAARRLCATRGERLTRPRERVLELLLQASGPLKAYDLLAGIAGGAGKAGPPTVYRALDFLAAQGLVHRIESLNAFIGCVSPKAPHSSQFLLCTGCGTATEIADPGIQTALGAAAKRVGFRPGHVTIEVKGLCRHCLAGAAASEPHAHAH